MKKFLSMILVLGLSATLLAGCGGSSDTADSGNSGDTAAEGNDAGYNTLNIIAAHGSTETVAQHTSYVYLKELLEERSGGAITMDIYPNQQLGGDREYTEACVQGNVTMGAPSPAAIAALCPSLNAFETPFLFSDYETARATMDSDAGKALLDSLEQYGLKGLGYYENGFRNLTCNKEINTLADLKGLKIRTMENNVHLAIWQALGANPSPLALSLIHISKCCTSAFLHYGEKAMEQIRNHVDGYELQQVTLGIVITAGMVSNLTVETVKNEYFYNDSIAHGFYYGCTVCPGAHKHLHGELVSMGILVLLTLDKQFETRDRLFPFYKALGLPMTMEAIELPESDLPTLVDKAATMDNWHYVPTPITKEQFTQAILDTDKAAKAWLAANK